MGVDISLRFTSAEITALLLSYDKLQLFRGDWSWGKVGLTFDYTTAIKEWTLVSGTTEYTYTDADGNADSVYEWAPYKTAVGLGPVRAAFEPDTVRAVSLLVALAQSLDPPHFVHSTLTTSSATVPADTKITPADDFYNSLFFLLLAGAYKGECRRISDWTQSGGVYTLASALTGLPGTVEYLVLPFSPDPALLAIQNAVAKLWPNRARRIEDSSLVVTTGEQVYSYPPPIRIIERVDYLPSTASLEPVELPFEPTGDGRFRLTYIVPEEDTALRVTGLAPYSIPYHLDAVVELAHPRQTRELLARAEWNLRVDPTSGLAPDADRLNRLTAIIAEESRTQATGRTTTVVHPVM
jgi:hypothetical protein